MLNICNNAITALATCCETDRIVMGTDVGTLYITNHALENPIRVESQLKTKIRDIELFKG